jgi:ribonuclease HII
MKSFPHLNFELELWQKGFLVAGIDEVGRGSFAGPLVVCAVVLKPIKQSNKKAIKQLLSLGINDSKLVKPNVRELIYKYVQEFILFFSIQYISVDIINDKNVGFANRKGFELVSKDIIVKTKRSPVFFLTDAFSIPKIKKSMQKNIIHGDSISLSIALASILAKAERDRFMVETAKKFSSYGFEKNKGYGTLFHRSSLKQHGPCPTHRKEFVRNYI